MRARILKALLIICCGLTLTAKAAYAQPPDTLWTRTYGGSESDFLHSLRKSADGGYVLAGFTESFGAGLKDMYLVKTDSQGNMEWDQTFGGAGTEECNYVHLTPIGGYILAGYTTSSGPGTAAAILVKTNMEGILEWVQTYGGDGSDHFSCVQVTPDSGYILSGGTDSFGAGFTDFYLVKTDPSGNQEWFRTFGGESNDWSYVVQVTADGGYIMGGFTQYSNPLNRNMYLVKTDASGNMEWERTFGRDGHESCYSIQQTPDGGYIVGGRTESMGAGMSDMYILKLDNQGFLEWEHTYGGRNNERCMDVQQTPDGGYLLGGRTETFGAGGNDMFLVKIDSIGNEQWQQAFGGTAWEYCESFQQTTDGGCVLGGMTGSYGAGNYDFYLVKLGPAGVLPWLVITLAPVSAPIVIPAGGGQFEFFINVENLSNEIQSFDLWCYVQAPGGNVYAVLGPLEKILDPYSNLTRLRSQEVPASAPGGAYNYWACIGEYPWYVVSSDSFSFIKEGLDDQSTGSGEWTPTCDPFMIEDPTDQSVSAESVRFSVGPNPFNQTTTLYYTLPEDAHVNLSVYDISGCEVANIVNGLQIAGFYRVTFDATDLPSGIYPYRLKLGHLSFCGKLVLIK